MQAKPLWQKIGYRQDDVLLHGGFSQSRNEGDPGKRQELRGQLRHRRSKATAGSRATGKKGTTMAYGCLGPLELSLPPVKDMAAVEPSPFCGVWLGYPRQDDAVATGDRKHFPLSS